MEFGSQSESLSVLLNSTVPFVDFVHVPLNTLFCVLQFLQFIEQLSSVLGIDSISADVGLDGANDAVLVRAEQLAKQEATVITDQKSQTYALKRKLKTMKEQLDGKV